MQSPSLHHFSKRLSIFSVSNFHWLFKPIVIWLQISNTVGNIPLEVTSQWALLSTILHWPHCSIWCSWYIFPSWNSSTFAFPKVKKKKSAFWLSSSSRYSLFFLSFTLSSTLQNRNISHLSSIYTTISGELNQEAQIPSSSLTRIGNIHRDVLATHFFDSFWRLTSSRYRKLMLHTVRTSHRRKSFIWRRLK